MTRSRLRPGYSVQSSRSRMVTTGGLSGPYVNPLLPRSRLGTEYYSPTLSKAQYDSTAFDYTIDNAMSRSSYLSSAAIDDFYDTSAKSRGKDRRLLDDTTTAIVSTETHSSPRNAVTIRRATRGRTPVGGAGGVRSSMQVKTASLSSSYPSASQAAIVASKLEMDEPRRRRPRSKFAADKLRSVRLESLESQGRANYPVSQLQSTFGLRASKPPLPKPTDRKSIRDVDGFTKPKNMLSWQHRLESRVDPTDIYHPGSFARMRNQILETQDKMDRHRQMLDRYLPAESGSGDSVESSILRKMEELERRDPFIFRGIGKSVGSSDSSSPRRH